MLGVGSMVGLMAYLSKPGRGILAEIEKDGDMRSVGVNIRALQSHRAGGFHRIRWK